MKNKDSKHLGTNLGSLNNEKNISWYKELILKI